MRTTKALLLAAAIGVAATVSSQAADPVYSANVVGFVNLNLTVGYNLICNPLQASNDTVGVIFPTLPNGSTVTKWNGFGYDSPISFDTDIFGGWEDPALQVKPGEAFFINVPTATTVTFVGDVRQGSLTNHIAANYAFVASQVPQAGGVTSVLGFNPLVDGTTLTQFQPGLGWGSPLTYDTSIFGGWEAEPVIAIGEGFLIQSPSVSGDWIRSFTVL